MADFRHSNEPTRKAYGLLHVGPYPMIGSKFGPLMGIVQSAGLPITEVLGVFHDDQSTVAQSELRSHACVCFAPGTEIPADLDLELVEIPGGEYVVGTHKGSYEGLHSSWGEFVTSVIGSGVKLGSMPCFEIYRNDCSQVPESELLTDMYTKVE